MRGLIPLRRIFSCICKPFDLIRSLTQSISSRNVEILSSDLTSPPSTVEITALFWEVIDEGHEQEDIKYDRMTNAIAVNDAVSIRTGTVTTIPFCIVEVDDDEEKDERIAINAQIYGAHTFSKDEKNKPDHTGFLLGWTG